MISGGRRRWGRAACFALVLGSVSGHVQAARAAGSTLPVTLHSFVGVPADSSDRREFMQGFRESMDADLPCEVRSGDDWHGADARPNPFRLVDVAPSDAAWTLDLSVGLPPAVRVVRPPRREHAPAPRPRMSNVRASRGLTIVVAALSPAGAGLGADSEPLRFAVYFGDSRRVIVPTPKLPGGGYDYPWADAGRVVAKAALEALHRGLGVLPQDMRADLAPATRREETP